MRQKLKWHNQWKHYLANFPSILYIERKFLSAQYRKEFTNDIHYELPNYSNSWSLILRWIIKNERNFRVLKPLRAHYVIVLRSMKHELPFFNKFINLRSDQRRLVCSWYCTSNHQYLLIFIDGLRLRHSFPHQNDMTSKSHYKASNLAVNQCLIPSVRIFKEFECKVKTFVDSL